MGGHRGARGMLLRVASPGGKVASTVLWVALAALVVAGCTPTSGPRGGATPEGAVPDDQAAEVGADGAVSTRAYGDHPDQVADLVLPDGAPPSAGWPVVVLVHGGFWREEHRRDLMTPLAADLAARGFASWNLEYRRVGGDGGWPATLTDVAAGIDHLGQLEAPIDRSRVAVVGHSAGGHLALWVAGRTALGADAPGADPTITPCLAVGQAPVADLAAAQGLGGGAVRDLLGGGPDDVPERYDQADPARLVGHGVPIVLVHGEADDVVPVDQSRRYAAAAEVAGDEVTVITLPGDHFAVIDPEDALWESVLDALEAAC